MIVQFICSHWCIFAKVQFICSHWCIFAKFVERLCT